jgi:protein-S-isoprenylcysteine O-methyltransferase Ste14
MPRLALLLVALWFLALFVFRTALQWWRTGSGGIRGFSGTIGSLEWNAGLVISLGLAAGVLAPAAALLGWPGGGLLFRLEPVHWLGAGLAALGIAGALASQVAMGDSWRIGVDESETTALVTRGAFRWVRNPIFSFMLLSGAGLAALVPNAFSLLSFLLTLAGLEIHVRAVEEPYLAKTHGPAYCAYAARVGRFLPGVGRLDAASLEASANERGDSPRPVGSALRAPRSGPRPRS